MSDALAGTTAIDLTSVRSGPTCTKILAAHTREVLAALGDADAEVDARVEAGVVEVAT